MKLVSFEHHGRKSFGIWTPEGIVDLKSRLTRRCDDLRSFLSTPEFESRSRFADAPIDVAEEDVVFLPVIDRPDKILCVGMNYQEKRNEFDAHAAAPTLFIRFAYTQTGHRGPLVKPVETNEFDYEGELAVVIGRAGHHIPAAQALDHVAGYSCYMDATVRDW